MKFSNKTLSAAFLFLAACTKAPQDHFHFGRLENQLIKEVRLEDMGGKTVHASSAQSQITLRAREYSGDEKAFANLKTKMNFAISNAFGTFNSSYPGTISKAVACDQSLLPEAVKNPAAGLIGYITNANDRLNFGVCDPKEIKFEMLYFVANCGEDRLYEVKTFRPASGKAEADMRDIFMAFRCR